MNLKKLLSLVIKWELSWTVKSVISNWLATASIQGKVLNVRPIKLNLGEEYVVNGEDTSLPYSDKEFDYTVVRYALEYIKPPLIEAFLAELERISKHVIITVPSPMWLTGFNLLPGRRSRIYRLDKNVIVIKSTLLSGTDFTQKLVLSPIFEVYS